MLSKSGLLEPPPPSISLVVSCFFLLLKIYTFILAFSTDFGVSGWGHPHCWGPYYCLEENKEKAGNPESRDVGWWWGVFLASADETIGPGRSLRRSSYIFYSSLDDGDDDDGVSFSFLGCIESRNTLRALFHVCQMIIIRSKLVIPAVDKTSCTDPEELHTYIVSHVPLPTFLFYLRRKKRILSIYRCFYISITSNYVIFGPFPSCDHAGVHCSLAR